MSIYALEEVSDALEEVCSGGQQASATASWWSSRGLSAILQPVTSEEGSLDGGLRHGCRVLCTWAEQDVLRPGLVYVVKAFRPEVLGVWQRYFHGSAALQLCLRVSQPEGTRPEDSHLQPLLLHLLLLLEGDPAAESRPEADAGLQPDQAQRHGAVTQVGPSCHIPALPAANPQLM